jgi:hypothetical protein
MKEISNIHNVYELKVKALMIIPTREVRIMFNPGK